MVQLPSEDSDQPFSAVTFPQFAVGFIVIAVALVLIACLSAQLKDVPPPSNPHSTSSATLSPQVQVADPPPRPVANCRDSFGATQFYSGPRIPNLVFYARHAPSGYRSSGTGGDRRAKPERLARECSPSTGSMSPSRWDFRP